VSSSPSAANRKKITKHWKKEFEEDKNNGDILCSLIERINIVKNVHST
jgi:hypothetical protein